MTKVVTFLFLFFLLSSIAQAQPSLGMPEQILILDGGCTDMLRYAVGLEDADWEKDIVVGDSVFVSGNISAVFAFTVPKLHPSGTTLLIRNESNHVLEILDNSDDLIQEVGSGESYVLVLVQSGLFSIKCDGIINGPVQILPRCHKKKI